MGIFKKIGKGIKKVFKKIGRGIKKAFKAFGKFMGKIGFAGQLALMFLFPAGIGSLLTKGLGKLGTALQAVGAKGGMLSKAFTGVGKILTKAQKFVTTVRSGFSSLTNGIKEFGKTALSKVGITLDGAAANFFGPESAWAKTQEGFAGTGKLIRGLKEGTIDLTEKTSLKDFSNRVGLTQADVKRLNPNLKFLKDGMIDMEGATSISMNVDLAGDAVRSVQASREALDNALSADDVVGGAKTLSSDEIMAQRNQSSFDYMQTDIAEAVKPVLTPDEIMAQRNQSSFDYMQPEAVKPIEALSSPKLPTLDNTGYVEGNELRMQVADEMADAIKPPESGKFSEYLGEVWNRSRESLDPSKAGLFRATSNWGNLASQFMTQEEQWSGLSKGVQDMHTGFTGFTPPDDYNMFAQTTNQFGSPALGEQLRLYKIYNPFEETMFNMRGRTA